MHNNGHITVFLSLTLLCILSLMCGLLESARTAGTRWYLKLAADSAMDSVFSKYHREAWDKYRIFLLEDKSGDQLEQDWLDYIKPYMEHSGWYSMNIESTNLMQRVQITDGRGKYMKQEILDYMKYGIFDHIPDEAGAVTMLADLKEAAAVKDLSKSYVEHTKEAVRLEHVIEDINSSLEKQKQIWQEADSCLNNYDGYGFIEKADDLKKEINRIPTLIKTYGDIADELNIQLQNTKNKKAEAMNQLSAPVQKTISSDTDWYDSYVRQDGERRKEVEALEGEVIHIKEKIERSKDRAMEVEQIIDEWDSSSDDDDDDDDDDGPDLSELWGSVRDIWCEIHISALSYTNGVKDPEKEKILEKVQDLVKNGLMALVLPEGKEVSKGVLNNNSFPSLLYTGEQGEIDGLIDRILFEEYCGRFLTNFLSEEGKDVKYEMEYLIAGKNTDEKNFSQAVSDILVMREGLNLVHILTDQEKREEANALAGVITGVTGLTPLTGLVAFFVMSIWAMGEAIVDIRRLLQGEKVSLIKSKENWRLSLGSLLDSGSQGKFEGGGSDNNGVDYTGYLKLILFVSHSSLQYYRLMDIIQMNLCAADEEFRMSHCIYRAEMKGTGVSRHFFFGGLEPVFRIDVRTEKAY
ncbi:DUF5702 domain-containing protein [Lacrimispora sp. 38-1]|uniref:DUF5702 domain-containing protein n=1 Tax=Lacrimispora sp. 38-1 TaxID=3125778 RepID=UPI003CEE0229